MDTTYFHEVQPPSAPGWMPFLLEIEVKSNTLRYRIFRWGRWRNLPLPEILGGKSIIISAKSWPVGIKVGLFGRRVISDSGRGVELNLADGKVLILGCQNPERLLNVLGIDG